MTDIAPRSPTPPPDPVVQRLAKEVDRLNEKFSENSEMLMKTQTNFMDMGLRVSYLEEGLKNTRDQMTRIQKTQDSLAEKFDNMREEVVGLRTDLPQLLTDMVTKINESVDKKMFSCRELQEAQNKSRFIEMPEGVKGFVIRLILVGLAGMFGLDMAGVIDLKKDFKELTNQSAEVSPPRSPK